MGTRNFGENNANQNGKAYQEPLKLWKLNIRIEERIKRYEKKNTFFIYFYWQENE